MADDRASARDEEVRRQAAADVADRYQLLVEHSPDGLCVHEAGRIVYVNPAAIRFVQAKSADRIIGRPISEFVAPESIPGMLARLESLTDHGAATEPSEANLLKIDGGTVSVELVSARTVWEGRPAFQVIMRDLSAQKTAEAALRFQAALVSHVTDAIIATTDDGIVTSWNLPPSRFTASPRTRPSGRLPRMRSARRWTRLRLCGRAESSDLRTFMPTDRPLRSGFRPRQWTADSSSCAPIRPRFGRRRLTSRPSCQDSRKASWLSGTTEP